MKQTSLAFKVVDENNNSECSVSGWMVIPNTKISSLPWNSSPPSLVAHTERGSSLRRKEPSSSSCYHEVLIAAPSEPPCLTTSSPLAATLSPHSLLLAKERRRSPEVPCNRRHEVLPRLEAEECGCRYLVALKACYVAAVLGATSCCLPYQNDAACSSRKFLVVILELLHRVEERRSYYPTEERGYCCIRALCCSLSALSSQSCQREKLPQTASHATSWDEKILAENILLFFCPNSSEKGARPKSFLGCLLPRP